MKTLLTLLLAAIIVFSFCSVLAFAETADELSPTTDEATSDYVPDNNRHIMWVYYVVAFCALGGSIGAAVLISKKHK